MKEASQITQAREYLAGTRRRKVNTLPPSVLMRELAETRRQLGQVLDVIDQATSAPEAGKPAAIRQLLAHFDWEFHDRQLALEEIDRIAEGPGQATTLTRAQLSTVLDALDVAADYKRDAAANCPDCEASPAELCGTCEWRLARAEAYDALAEALRDRRKRSGRLRFSKGSYRSRG